MKCLKNMQFLLIGIVIGGVMFGGFTAYAAGITAYNKTATIMIDGEVVDLKGYLIEGTHYFQLRELDVLLKKSGKDFAIVWDGTNNRVLIDTSRGYVPDESFQTPVIIVPESTSMQTSLESAPAPAQTAATEPKMSIDEMKAEFVRLTNEERVKAGASELKILPELMECAQLKADDMRDNEYFGHISPKYGSPSDMIKSYIPNPKSVGENLAGWSKTPSDAINGLVNSTDHHQIMTNSKYTHIGVGVVEGVDGGYWWVQQFVKL